MIKLIKLAAVVMGLLTSQMASAASPDFEISFGKVAKKSVFKSDQYSIWGGSVVKGDDNKYHMLYARWPKGIGWEWVTYSEIAHAVADSPFGPFKHQSVVLEQRGSQYWDGKTTHNPTVHQFNGKYYLYYMGTTGDMEIVSKPGKPKLNWMHRNNQRIGVAVADKPSGPWQRFDQPVIDISRDDKALDALMTSNPAITEKPDGGYLAVYKAVGKTYPLPGGGPVVHMVAEADSPSGPFKKHPQPIFTEKGVRFPAEDPYIWYQDGRYRAIVKKIDHPEGGGRVFSLVHYDSENGIDWQPGKYFKVSDLVINWEDGSQLKLDHLERPQVYLEDGKPVAIMLAADTKDNNNVRHSFNVQIPLSIKKHY
ncbi:glycoside hydrolase family protein [Gayadomonas joobiniege]|uniref:glycoside hydrolase family protein n=1 Tax=Gayadomonas joobiniege TaxID=1234606 RepID=UPI00036CD04A|nr:glycoside hydrolase family protein [Gayadomonas joobiniege]